MSRKKKKNYFKVFLINYVRILIVLMLLIILYVVNSLITYKNLQVDNFLASTMEKVAEAGERDNISKYVDISSLTLSKYESNKSSKDQAVAEVLKTSELVYKLNSDSTDLNNPVYDVYIKDTPIFHVTLNGEKKLTRLGLLTMQDWQVSKMELVNSKGFFDCTIEVPNNYTVYVNDIKLESDSADGEASEELNELSKYAN